MMFRRILLLCVAVSFTISLQAQQIEDTTSAHRVSTRYIDNIASKTDWLSSKLDRQSEKALRRLQHQEAKIQRKLARKDSTKAASIFANAEGKYLQLETTLKNGTSPQHYIAVLDTIGCSIKFLQQNPKLLEKATESQRKLSEAMAKVSGLENRFQKAEAIKQFMKERRQYLTAQLEGIGLTKELKGINKEVYYFSEQVNEYKTFLKDHKKAERKAIEVLSKTKLFKDFLRKNSQLASLFRLPGTPDDPTQQANLAGLQTRVQVNSLIQQQLAMGGPDARQQFQQNIQQAQDQLNQLKNKMNRFGKGSSDAEMPGGFKPNNQKTKRFFQRLEIGTNIQSQKGRNYFPVTSDLGVSLGYKLNDNSVIGIGASYKLGWGRDIRHINITHQGAGLRSFIDWRVKGSLWLTGGYEMNYRNEFKRITELKELNAWQQSGLIGLSKVISIKTRFFRKTKLQLLWDFLSYQQIPKTQSILFRVGYNFK